ncbi:MAG: ATPase [Proteobacteria bacterium]|nr:ATPase [Pseudomonadota bacterium]
MTGTEGGFPGEKRTDRLIHEHVHDPYRKRKKIQEPSVCSECSAVYNRGRWIWGDRPDNAHEETCPACERVKDNYPAGILNLSGEFFGDHREEIINLIRNEEEKEKGEHPLHRIITVEDDDKGTEITTTDIHLPRRIGEALRSAYGGDLDYHYEEESYFLRVNWAR